MDVEPKYSKWTTIGNNFRIYMTEDEKDNDKTWYLWIF